ncbi:nucleotidyltransferase domain-containing protein [Endothiovibrio diazotrophicus]
MTDSPTVPIDPSEMRSPRRRLRHKADLAYLPESKACQLRRISQWICEAVPVDWVILFGSYARGGWAEDPETGYESDYDLLVIPSKPALTENSRLWARLERDLRALADPVSITLLVHSIKEVNRHLRKGQEVYRDTHLRSWAKRPGPPPRV